MKRIKAACLEQTIHFQLKEGLTLEAAKEHEGGIGYGRTGAEQNPIYDSDP